MAVLNEGLTYDQAKMVVESSDSTGPNGMKNLFMKGIFIVGGVRNLNERVYPLHEISSAVDSINDRIKQGKSVLGECDHPAELTINLDRVSHVIENMWMDGNAGMGKLRILSTPHGNIIRTLLESNVKLGVSSRGSGNVRNGGVVEDFDMRTVDIVADPSAATAIPVPVYEAFNSRRGTMIDDLARSVAHDPKAKVHLAEAMRQWINTIR